MKSLKENYIIKESIEKVWEALTNPESINDWGAGPAEMDENEGTNFKLWGGDIWGTNTKVEKGKKLVQEWYSGDWPTPSIVTIDLIEEKGKTKITLNHTNIPDDEYSEIKSGWKNYYFGPIKELLELGG